MDLEEALAALTLGILDPESLPSLAVDALAAGYSSRSLAVLASDPSFLRDPRRARDTFADAISELGLISPDTRVAANLLIERTCSAAVSGNLSPDAALHRLVREILPAFGEERGRSEFLGESLGLARIVSLYWDYDELDQPWAPVREKLDQAEIEALAERLRTA